MTLEKSDQKRVAVSILEQEYIIKGNEEPEYIQMLAAYLDQRMKDIKHKNSNLPLLKVAVLTALNLADELIKVQEDYDGLVSLIEEAKRR